MKEIYRRIVREFIGNRVLLQPEKTMPMHTIDYEHELNESQYAAVRYIDGPSLVIAGAGAGKTRVLTYKIAYLLEHGYAPSSILALTFTNKAAGEMKERIARQVGWEKARCLWMGTFHSVFSRILRGEPEATGFPAHFTIYDQSDSRSLIKSIVAEMGLDKKEEGEEWTGYRATRKESPYKPATVQARISQAKNHLILPDAYAADPEIYRADSAAKIPLVRDIYRRYMERCRQAGAMDFDDLLVYTYLLFDRYPDICRKYASHFRFILVDEYQDTNHAQHCIIRQLTRENRNVCVVGDDAQSIYSFRGARIENILEFTRQYEGARLFKLERNYRSTRMIVEAANSLIAKNRDRIKKTVFSEREEGEPVTLFSAYSDIEEGEIVVNKIVELHRREAYAYADFAILYRTNAQSRIFEEALRKRSLPYRIYGGLSFYQRKEIKDVIAYFRLAVNPRDEEAFKRVVNYPARGIGDTTLKRIVAEATASHLSLWKAAAAPDLSLSKAARTKLQLFRELIEEFGTEAAEKDAYTVGQEIIRRSGIRDDIYKDCTVEGLTRRENVEELINGIHTFCSMREEEGDARIFLSDFLSEVSLLSDQDMDKTAGEDRVTLMTVHAAKGLEFKTVFVVGMEEGLFPSNMCSDSPKEIEEERRLFYVALTRAGERCYLSFARSRFRYGRSEFCNPSCFLRDIDSRCLSLPDDLLRSRRTEEVSRPRILLREERAAGVPAASSPESRRFVPFARTARPAPAKSGGTSVVEAGQTIEHERFGVGEVIRVEGEGENCKATVRFRHAGEKQLLLRFARFKVIG